MPIPKSNCDSNQRCEVCPIQRLEDADARIWGAQIVTASRRTLNDDITSPSQASVETVVQTVEYFADEFNRPELAGAAVGALAITMADKCKLEE